jgi:hypothetical protein
MQSLYVPGTNLKTKLSPTTTKRKTTNKTDTDRASQQALIEYKQRNRTKADNIGMASTALLDE